MAKSIEELRREAQTVKMESADSANTAMRVGGLNEDIVDALENHQKAIEAIDTDAVKVDMEAEETEVTVGGVTMRIVTAAQWEAMETLDPNTLYTIVSNS